MEGLEWMCRCQTKKHPRSWPGRRVPPPRRDCRDPCQVGSGFVEAGKLTPNDDDFIRMHTSTNCISTTAATTTTDAVLLWNDNTEHWQSFRTPLQSAVNRLEKNNGMFVRTPLSPRGDSHSVGDENEKKEKKNNGLVVGGRYENSIMCIVIRLINT